MFINRVSSPSFKAVVPVVYMAKNPKDNQYVPVIKRQNLRKCHGYIVRNLNGTAKKNPNTDFVDFYRRHDKDYANVPLVHSVYQQRGPIVYMVTGNDADTLNEMAKPVGKAKSESIEALGHSKSFEAQLAAKNYQNSANKFVQNSNNQLKSKDDNSKISLYAYFEPEYTKREQKLKGFNFLGCQFIKDNHNNRH